jgi:hypothetical protein
MRPYRYGHRSVLVQSGKHGLAALLCKQVPLAQGQCSQKGASNINGSQGHSTAMVTPASHRVSLEQRQPRHAPAETNAVGRVLMIRAGSPRFNQYYRNSHRTTHLENDDLTAPSRLHIPQDAELQANSH